MRFIQLKLIVILVLFCTSDRLISQGNSDLTQQLEKKEIAKVIQGLSNLQDLESFYIAEENLLKNLAIREVVIQLNSLAQKTQEPIIKSRAVKLLKLAASKGYRKFPDFEIFSHYFSSNHKLRQYAVTEIWQLNDLTYSNLLKTYLEQDPSYEVQQYSLLALADMEINDDVIAGLIIGVNSQDENFAISCMCALIRYSEDRGLRLLKKWLQKPNIEWQFKAGWDIQETKPMHIEWDVIKRILTNEDYEIIYDNLYEIMAFQVEKKSQKFTQKVLSVLKMLINDELVLECPSWDKLWHSISLRTDLCSFFSSIDKPEFLPMEIWIKIAKINPEIIFNYVLDNEKSAQKLGYSAMIQAGFGIELLQRILITDLISENYLTLKELIQKIRRLTNLEIYIAEHYTNLNLIKISAYYQNCSLYELLASVSHLCNVRYDFNAGRLLILSAAHSFTGRYFLTNMLPANSTQNLFDTFILREEIPSLGLFDFHHKLSEILGKTVIISGKASKNKLYLPVFKKDAGLQAPLTRALKSNSLEIIISGNIIWIVSKPEAEIMMAEQVFTLKHSVKTLVEIAKHKTAFAYLTIAELLNTPEAFVIKNIEYLDFVLQMLKNDISDTEKALFIKCLGNVKGKKGLDIIISYLKSTKYKLRNAAKIALSNELHPKSWLLNYYQELNLSAQNYIRNLISKDLKASELKNIFRSMPKVNSKSIVFSNTKAFGKLIFDVMKKDFSSTTLEPRNNIKKLGTNPLWLLHLLSQRIGVDIKPSPVLRSKILTDSEFGRKTFEFSYNNLDIQNSLKKLSVEMTLESISSEFISVANVNYFSADNRKNGKTFHEFVLSHPEELELLFFFKFMLSIALDCNDLEQKSIFNELWIQTANTNLIINFKTNSYKSSKFISMLKSDILKTLIKLENKLSFISVDFAKLGIRLRKLMNHKIPELYKDYNDFPDSWFDPEKAAE